MKERNKESISKEICCFDKNLNHMTLPSSITYISNRNVRKQGINKRKRKLIN